MDDTKSGVVKMEVLTEFETKIYRALLSAKKGLEIQCRKRSGTHGSAAVHQAFLEMLANPNCSRENLKNTPVVRAWIRFGVQSVYKDYSGRVDQLPVEEAEVLVATLCKRYFSNQIRTYLKIDMQDADHPVHGHSISLNMEVGDKGGTELGDLIKDESKLDNFDNNTVDE